MTVFASILAASLVAFWVVYELLHRLIFGRILPHGFTSRALAGVATYLISVLAYGVGADDGSGFRLEGLAIYFVPALLAMALAVRTGREENSGAAVAG